MAVTLFHYTDQDAWRTPVDPVRPGLEAAGVIVPYSMNATSFFGELPLIWLSDSTDPRTTGLEPARTTIRMTVRLSRGVVPWVVHKHQTGVGDGISRPLEVAGTSDPATWYVVSGEIPIKMWIEAVDLSSGALLWSAGPGGSAAAPACDPIGPVDLDELEADLRAGYQAYAQDNLDASALLRGAEVLTNQVNAARALARDLSPLGQVRSNAALRALCEQATALPACSKQWVQLLGEETPLAGQDVPA
ncbi:hypothetical protein [Kitasatospora purpeofusca]|uniref:hypothetical protein n=1 Tax=Kitasatospora purpeofusca TaxID=67352 RepID=UPI003676775F